MGHAHFAEQQEEISAKGWAKYLGGGHLRLGNVSFNISVDNFIC